MDNTISNVSQLEIALSKMKRPSIIDTPSNSNISTPILTPHDQNTPVVKDEYVSTEYATQNIESDKYKPISRNSTGQFATGALLQNLAGLQTTTNNKIDNLTDAVLGLHNYMERLLKEQAKQTELLATIARNTVAISSASVSQTSQKSTSKNSNLTIKDYGFNDNQTLLTEFLMKMLDQIKRQAINKARQYRTTRDFKDSDLKRIIKLSMKNKFKINGTIEDEIEAKGNKVSAYVTVASKIGSVNNTIPVLTKQSFSEIFDDTACTIFVRHLERIIERLIILKVLIPYYEADILASIQYPYFGKDGEVLCDWSKILPREETKNEIICIKASIKEQEQIAQLLAKGVSEKYAISAAIKST